MTTRLIIGGARSGKSRFAEKLLADTAEVTYVATSQGRADDAEWAQRVAVHRARRPKSWETVETLDLAGVLAEPGPPVLVDCLTVWLSRQLDETGSWPEAPGEGWAGTVQPPVSTPDLTPAQRLEGEVRALIDAIATTGRDVVLVTNEVGQGLVPATAGERQFRDEMGILNIRVAEACDEVWLVAAGLPLRLKG